MGESAKSNEASATPVSSPTATTVMISSIEYYTEGGPNKKLHLRIVATAVDNLGNPVGGASVSVSVNLDGAYYASMTATTGTDGKVLFKLNNAPSGCYSTTVTNVTAQGLSWDGNTPTNSFCK
jgi:hypothetical protein